MEASEAEYIGRTLGRGFVGLNRPGEDIGVLFAVLEGIAGRVGLLSVKR